jgi:mono/diheme cytochrome c family protein
MRTWTFLATLVFAAAIATAQTTAATPQTQAQAAQAPAGNADTGKKLYSSYGCYACHGLEGQGGAAGPRIAPRPFPLAGFITFIRRPPNQMPLYTERIVSDEELGHIHAFLEAIPAPPPVESIPLLQE